MSTQTDSRREEQDVATTVREYRAAVETQDVDRLIATLAEDVVMRSPISSLAQLEGHAAIRDVLSVVFAQIADPRFVAELGTGDHERSLFLRSRVGSQKLEEAVWLRFDEHGLISELTLFIRPVAALTALMAAIGPPLAARHSRTRATIAAAMTRPIAALMRQGDPLALRLTGIRRKGE